MELKCFIFLFSTCKGRLVDCKDSCAASKYRNYCKMLFLGVYFYFLTLSAAW